MEEKCIINDLNELLDIIPDSLNEFDKIDELKECLKKIENELKEI